MRLRRLTTLLAALALCLAPAPALGQGGAGDEQYEDPFAGEEQPVTDDDGGTIPQEEAPGLEDTLPDTGGGGEPSQETAPDPGTEPAPAAGEPALPATGGEALLLALLGSGLVLSGAGLRLRLD